MTPLYWQVYLNLEREFLGLTDIIFVNDAQQNVYSMKIADLLIRTVIEIEALAKELYLSNGGAVIPDEEMYFDTVCIAHLDGLWKLDSKMVLVASPNIFFDEEENKVLHPLHKASKRGTSSADWNKAYQAVKHNRVKEISKGSIKNLLHGLAALYVLNLYYKEDSYKNLSFSEKTNVNPSFGSSLFAVKIHGDKGLKADGVFNKGEDYDECIYIIDYEPNSKKSCVEALVALSEYEYKGTQDIIEKLASEKAARGEPITDEWVQQEQEKLFAKIFPIKDYQLSQMIANGLTSLRYEVVLNKQQY